ncbi:MAG: ribonuclease HI [Myxococcales bacterium]|nr:ribonuclease HI [Myxococcales bacterium]MCB9709208.1 ribonuclease HI [Myxococcales bacterium]
MTHAPTDPIVVYTDGACSGNPGPSGLGVVMRIDGEERELSEYLGEGTNNIAELTAILRALCAIDDTHRPVTLYTDSQYAIGVLTKQWKAKANQALILQIKEVLSRFSRCTLHYVRGHNGDPLNERADELAVQAVQNRASQVWTSRSD